MAGFGPAKDGDHEESALEGFALGCHRRSVKIEIGGVDVEDGEDAVRGGAEEKDGCGESAQAGGS